MRSTITDLNALPPIKERTRLVIGSALAVSTTMRSDPIYWSLDAVESSIWMSFDPVAHDTIGLGRLTELVEARGEESQWITHLANRWLQAAANLGLGTIYSRNMELVELDLG